MFFHPRCVALLALLPWHHAAAQGFQNASSTRPTPSTSLNATITPSPSRTLNSSSMGYVESCNSAWSSYSWHSLRPYESELVEYTETFNATTSLLGYQTCSSYCGSICYADHSTITSTLVVPGPVYKTDWSYKSWRTFSDDPPNCKIAASDCSKLWTSYSSAEVEWSKSLGGEGRPETPACTQGCQRTTCFFGGGDKGVAPTQGVSERYWNSLKVFYFPETKTTSRDMCATSPTNKPIPPPAFSTYIPTTTEGFVVQDGKTLYKGNVYISVDQLEVRDNCGYTKVMHDIAFPVASTDIQSDRANEGIQSKYWSVNWDDFNEPVPYSAWAGGQGMSFSAIDPGAILSPDTYCKTAICDREAVYPGQYNPWMVLPQAIRELDPEFADCDVPEGLTWYDPPIALHSKPGFLTTAAPLPASTAAKPASSIVALPVETANPAASRASYVPPPGATFSSTIPDNAQPNDPEPNDPESNDPGSGAGSGAGAASKQPPYPNPDPASRPQVTVGPTVLPVAPDGSGLVIHSPTTLAPSASAIIGSTTFHLTSGVLTMVSADGTSSMTLGTPEQNAVGTVVALGSGGAFTISSAAGSLIFNVRTTLKAGDAAQTVAGGEVVSVGSDGVYVSDPSNGKETFVAFTDVEGENGSGVTRKEGSFDAAAFTGATFGDDGGASGGGILTADPTAASSSSGGEEEGETKTGSGRVHASTGTDTASSASGASGSDGSAAQPSNKGAAASLSVPWIFELLGLLPSFFFLRL